MNSFDEMTHVRVKEYSGFSIYSIALETKTRVWINATYADGHNIEGAIQVGDGIEDGFDLHGNCILSVPKEICKFLSEEDANQYMEMQAIDEKMLANAY